MWRGSMGCARRCRCSRHWQPVRMRSLSGRTWRSTVLSDVRYGPRCIGSPHCSNPCRSTRPFSTSQAPKLCTRACPAQLLARLAKRVETVHGITVSIGLSDNKFLARIASDLDKPRGFTVLSRSEAPAFLAGKPVSLLWGVGTAMQRRLAGDGITLVGQLAEIGDRELASRYGRVGARLAHLASRTCSGAHDFGRDHFGTGRVRCECAHARIVAALRAPLGPIEGSLSGCQHDRVETEDRRFSLADALPPCGGSDTAGRYAFSHRIRLAHRRD